MNTLLLVYPWIVLALGAAYESAASGKSGPFHARGALCIGVVVLLIVAFGYSLGGTP